VPQRKRCAACRKRFVPRRAIDRYCPACWSLRQAGYSAGWIAERERLIDADMLDAVARDDMRDRR
jgi:hypothetical protein